MSSLCNPNESAGRQKKKPFQLSRLCTDTATLCSSWVHACHNCKMLMIFQTKTFQDISVGYLLNWQPDLFHYES